MSYLSELSALADRTGSPEEETLADIAKRHRFPLDQVRDDAARMRRIAVREAVREVRRG